MLLCCDSRAQTATALALFGLDEFMTWLGSRTVRTMTPNSDAERILTGMIDEALAG